MGIVPEDRHQALRFQRVLMAAVAYLLWIGVSAYLFWLELIVIPAWVMGCYYLGMIATNLFFLVLIRTGFNLRLRDPSMTLIQILIAVAWAMVLVGAAEAAARGVLLLLFFSAFFFGVFRLTTVDFLGLTVYACLLYGGLIFMQSPRLSPEELRLEIVQLVVVAVVLLWMSFMGGYVATLRARLREATRRDDLTGAHNRRAITRDLEQALGEVAGEGKTLSVVLLDIDHFKSINDQYGHMVGDEILREFVERIQQHLRGEDFMADLAANADSGFGRFGGEEFLVVLPGTDAAGARRCGERLRDAVARSPFVTEGGKRIPVTVSAGVAEWRPGEDLVGLLGRADRALYASKQNGRDQVSVHEWETAASP